ncbi:MAG: hypothetical protein AAF787_20310 [Chloroflexota bacterium]
MFNTYQFLFEFSLVFIAYCIVIATVLVTRRRLRPFAVYLLIGLVAFEIVLAVTHVRMLEVTDVAPFWRHFFNLQGELNMGSIFSAFQLAMVGVIAGVNGWFTPGLRWWQRAYWLLLLATFLFLSFDEYHAFHETLGGRVVSEAWRIPYALAGGVLVLISVAVYWYGSNIPLRLFAMIFMGLLIAAIAGIGIEEFVLQGYYRFDDDLEWMFVWEEFFEMVGATIVLAGVLSYMQEFIPDSRQARARIAISSGAALIIAWYAFAQFALPDVQARYTATPANVDYEDGLLTLVAYNVEPAVARPGDEVMIALYWRANEPLPEDYSFSAHVLQYPDGRSIAQSDSLHMGVIPSQAWFPGVTQKQKYYVNIPRSVDAPASLGIMARVWYGPWPFLRPWQDTTGLPVSNFGSLQELAHDAVVLDKVIALSAGRPERAPVDTRHEFNGASATLMGYQLPQETVEGRTLPMSFWWRTPRRFFSRPDLSQALHIVNTQRGDLYTFDRPPFSGRFPTPDWTPNMRERSDWRVTLPEDLPAGEYEVYTGLYDWQTGARIAVTDNRGTPIENDMIYLGNFTYAPREELLIAGRSNEEYCYGVANFNVRENSEKDSLIAINRTTGEAEFVGGTGTVEVENLSFNVEGTQLYAVEELQEDEIGLFGTISPIDGAFTPVGDGLVPRDNPASNRRLGRDTLFDVDGIDVDMTTGILWAVTQDGNNFLFQINPNTGEIVRGVFGEGFDYVKVEIAQFRGADFVDVEGFAIHPQTGEFYVIAASDDYVSRLARIDFDTFNESAGTVMAVDPVPFRNTQNGRAILDVEGLTFYRDGSMYITSSNNSNSVEIYDSLWRVDMETGDSEWIDSMENHVQFVDYESVACYTG